MKRPFQPTFVLRSTLVEPLADAAVCVLLESLTRIDLLSRRWCAATGAPLPLLYASGVRYQRENYAAREENWLDVLELYRLGFGDCEDLACARAAELQELGENAVALAVAKRRTNGSRLLHVVVKRGDGSTEDPSARLGMTGAG